MMWPRWAGWARQGGSGTAVVAAPSLTERDGLVSVGHTVRGNRLTRTGTSHQFLFVFSVRLLNLEQLNEAMII